MIYNLIHEYDVSEETSASISRLFEEYNLEISMRNPNLSYVISLFDLSSNYFDNTFKAIQLP
jgi:hypothetical protein